MPLSRQQLELRSRGARAIRTFQEEVGEGSDRAVVAIDQAYSLIGYVERAAMRGEMWVRMFVQGDLRTLSSEKHKFSYTDHGEASTEYVAARTLATDTIRLLRGMTDWSVELRTGEMLEPKSGPRTYVVAVHVQIAES